jgi:hypothetical protein
VDASEKAIAAVIYLQTNDTSGTKQLGFVLGKAKLAPPRTNLLNNNLPCKITGAKNPSGS